MNQLFHNMIYPTGLILLVIRGEFIFERFRLDTPGETTTWITSICSMACCERVDGTLNSSSATMSIKMHIFSVETCSSTTSLYITFTWFTIQFLLLSTFSFLFPQTFYLSTWFLSQHKSWNWTPDINVNKAMYIVPIFFCCGYYFPAWFYMVLTPERSLFWVFSESYQSCLKSSQPK